MKNFKVVQVQGLSGLLLLGLFSTGVFCGFVLFPVWLTMIFWNSMIAETFRIPIINYFQSALLWSAILLTIYLILKNSISIEFKKAKAETGVDVDKILEDIEKHKETSESDKD